MTSRAVPLDLATLHVGLTGDGRPAALVGDALAVNDDNFAWLPDGAVDLVLTDPPFNIARDTNFHTYAGNTIHSYRFDGDRGWDSHDQGAFVALLHAWAAEFARVLRPGGSFAVFCADEYLSHLIDALTAAGLHTRRTITWRKPNAVPVNRQYMPMSACEYIVMGVKGRKATFNATPAHTVVSDELVELERFLVPDKAAAVVETAVRAAIDGLTATADRPGKIAAAVADAVRAAADEAGRRVASMYADGHLRGCVPNHLSHTSKGGNRLHPTEKPVAVLRYLTALLSAPGDVVLDAFAGSASTGEAAVAVGRRVVLVEKDPGFYTAGLARLGG